MELVPRRIGTDLHASRRQRLAHAWALLCATARTLATTHAPAITLRSIVDSHARQSFLEALYGLYDWSTDYRESNPYVINKAMVQTENALSEHRWHEIRAVRRYRRLQLTANAQLQDAGLQLDHAQARTQKLQSRLEILNERGKQLAR